MSDYSEFFLNSASNIVGVECLEMSHSNFSKTYYVVRNAINGITVKHEDGNDYDYQYYPLSIQKKASLTDLGSGLTINLGDLGLILPQELDRIRAAKNFIEKPQIRYRLYRSDRLTAAILGPILLEVTTLSQTREGAAFDADAPQLNINKTGEVYKLDRFPMLRGGL